MHRQFWTGYCHSDRLSAMADIESAIRQHGYVLNFQRFSDLSLGLLIETTPPQLAALYEQLQQIMVMSGLEPVPADAPAEFVVFLNVTFTHGGGELRIEVPHVPG